MYHILADRRRNSSVLDFRSFGPADCDNDHYLQLAKVRERLAVSKQRPHRFHMERFNLKKMRIKEDIIRGRKFKIIRSKERNLIAVVTGSKRNKLG
jgi:hypothetical protein